MIADTATAITVVVVGIAVLLVLVVLGRIFFHDKSVRSWRIGFFYERDRDKESPPSAARAGYLPTPQQPKIEDQTTAVHHPKEGER